MTDVVFVNRLDDRIRVSLPRRSPHDHDRDFPIKRNLLLCIERPIAQKIESVLNLRYFVEHIVTVPVVGQSLAFEHQRAETRRRVFDTSRRRLHLTGGRDLNPPRLEMVLLVELVL